MSLKELSFPSTLNTSNNDLISDFFVPVLSNSIQYDRGVGYFSSGWLRIAAIGMVGFAKNSGRARWVVSPILYEKDWEAMLLGDEARKEPSLKVKLLENIVDLKNALEKETLSALAWMVADGIIEFRIALPRNKLDKGDFHDKFGIFTDRHGNQISFLGSYNDSIQGNRNYESIKVFRSWESSFATFVFDDSQRFEKLWKNQDPNVSIYRLPSAARDLIIRYRTVSRPYSEPNFADSSGDEYVPSIPAIPSDLILRDYQIEAIEAWFNNSNMGFLEMATGTGKTITALAASAKLFDKNNQIAVIIAAPFQHLVDQWKEESERFGYRPILAYQSKASWLNDLNTQIHEYNSGYRSFISVITTHTTFISEEFQRSISQLQENTLFIADEAHHLGAERSRLRFPNHIHHRLALSATPQRWYDDVGSISLNDYFGDTVFSFTLEDAIGFSLTPYYYYPQLVSLTYDELEEYIEISKKIARIYNREDVESQEILKMLLFKRVRLLNTAENKINILSELLDSEDELHHALFYCAPGQIDDVLSMLGLDKGLLVHRFTAEENAKERQELLSDFAKGELQALVAMKCLDEGVDVPSTQTAFILASSSNPREFIQRRGRILRKFPGKEFSTVYDLITVPPSNWVGLQEDSIFKVERGIIRKELQRFKEFANPSLNKHQAIDVIWDIANRYGLLDF